MIELDNISQTYQRAKETVPVLDGISLSVKRKEIVGVIGPSGAGKSTLLRTVNLLGEVQSGAILFDGQDLCTLPKRQLRQVRQRIGMVFQHFNLIDNRTVRQNIALPLKWSKAGQSKSDCVDTWIQRVGLSERAGYYPSQLSGGQKQRVAIARALVNQPQALLCDEITSALDPETTASILKLIRDLTDEHDLAVLFVTHDMAVIKAIADRVVVLDQGKVVEQGRVIDIFKQPKSPITQVLVQGHANDEWLPKLNVIEAENTPLLLRVRFFGHQAVEPVIDDLIRHTDLQVNIIQAHVESVGDELVGSMVVSLEGYSEQMASAIDYLQQKNCQTKIIGHINEYIE